MRKRHTHSSSSKSSLAHTHMVRDTESFPGGWWGDHTRGRGKHDFWQMWNFRFPSSRSRSISCGERSRGVRGDHGSPGSTEHRTNGQLESPEGEVDLLLLLLLPWRACLVRIPRFYSWARTLSSPPDFIAPYLLHFYYYYTSTAIYCATARRDNDAMRTEEKGCH